MDWQHIPLTVEYGTLACWALIMAIPVCLIGICYGAARERRRARRKGGGKGA